MSIRRQIFRLSCPGYTRFHRLILCYSVEVRHNVQWLVILLLTSQLFYLSQSGVRPLFVLEARPLIHLSCRGRTPSCWPR